MKKFEKNLINKKVSKGKIAELVNLYENLTAGQKKLADARIGHFLTANAEFVRNVLEYAASVKGKQIKLEIIVTEEFCKKKADCLTNLVKKYRIKGTTFYVVEEGAWEKNYNRSNAKVTYYYLVNYKDGSYKYIGTKSEDEHIWAKYRKFNLQKKLEEIAERDKQEETLAAA